MKSMIPLRILAAAGLLAAASAGAVEKGGTVYSKRNETNLLAEPRPLPPAAGKAGFTEPLKVAELRGTWLNVKGKPASGWVFTGNISEEKPSLPPPAGWTSIEASDTQTAAAARPLAPVASGYADRRQSKDPKEDLGWIEKQAARIVPAAVVEYMRANKKGEYQP